MPRVLFVQHDPASPLGHIGADFVRHGYDVETFLVLDDADFRDPARHDKVVAFPDFRDYDAVVIMGSVHGVYAEDEVGNWLRPEKARLRQALAAEVPVLGLCFGGQMLAEAVGGSVAPSPAVEIGWSLVHSDDESVIPGGAWFQWHSDRWRLPEGVADIARNAAASQGFAHGRSVGVQFHPEITPDQLRGWLAYGGDRLARAKGLDPDVLLAHTEAMVADAEERAGRLVDAFVARARRD